MQGTAVAPTVSPVVHSTATASTHTRSGSTSVSVKRREKTTVARRPSLNSSATTTITLKKSKTISHPSANRRSNIRTNLSTSSNASIASKTPNSVPGPPKITVKTSGAPKIKNASTSIRSPAFKTLTPPSSPIRSTSTANANKKQNNDHNNVNTNKRSSMDDKGLVVPRKPISGSSGRPTVDKKDTTLTSANAPSPKLLVTVTEISDGLNASEEILMSIQRTPPPTPRSSMASDTETMEHDDKVVLRELFIIDDEDESAEADLDDTDVADSKSTYRHHKIFLSADDDEVINLLFDDKSILSTSTKKFRPKLSPTRTAFNSQPEPIEELASLTSFLAYSSLLFTPTASPSDSEDNEQQQQPLSFDSRSQSVEMKDTTTSGGHDNSCRDSIFRDPLSVPNLWSSQNNDGTNSSPSQRSSNKKHHTYKPSRIRRLCRSVTMKAGKFEDDRTALEEYSIPYSSFLTPPSTKNKSPSGTKENIPHKRLSLPFIKNRPRDSGSSPVNPDHSCDNNRSVKSSSIIASEVVKSDRSQHAAESSDLVECDANSTMPSSAQLESKMDDEVNENLSSNIRRSWSHIEVRTIKGLFQRKRSSSNDVKRRNSYAYQTGSSKTNQRIAAESEIKVLNYVVGNPDDRKNKNAGFGKKGGKKDKRKNVDGDDTVEPNFTRISNNPPQLPLDIFGFVKKDVLKAIQMRRFIINEIYSTEKSYMENMRILKKVFIDPFTETTNPLANSLDASTIFAHVDGLIRLSTRMVESFENSASLREDSESKIGEIFLNHQEEFDVFRQYAGNHQQSVTAVKKANENVLYKKFIQ
ncbi:16047_t:CDS:2, partial [Acaulospora colombiana]